MCIGIKVSDPLELELQTVMSRCGCWELNHGPLEEQLEEHLQPPEVGVFKF